MGKARTLANTVSAGGPLEDGLIAISDVSGLQAALDSKTSLVSGAAITTSSGTSVEFTGIPASAKKIKLLLRNVSTSGSSNTWFRIQLGTSGGYVASGYGATVTAINSTAASTAFDNIGFMAAFSIADAELYSGVIEFEEISPNVWVMSGQLKASTTRMCFSAGDVRWVRNSPASGSLWAARARLTAAPSTSSTSEAHGRSRSIPPRNL